MRISDWSSDVCSSDLRGEVTHRFPKQLWDFGHHEDGARDCDVPIRRRAAGGVAPLAPGAIRLHRASARHRRRASAGRSKRRAANGPSRSEEHTSELQSLMRISYAVFCLKKKIYNTTTSAVTVLMHNIQRRHNT